MYLGSIIGNAVDDSRLVEGVSIIGESPRHFRMLLPGIP